MLTTRVFEYSTGRFLFAKAQPFRRDIADETPDVPALPETLLSIELQLQERSADLSIVSQAVLADLGATIQILRLAGSEYGNSGSRPVRIEDCIADLGLEACLRAAGRGTFVRGALHRAVFDLWEHSHRVALHSRLLAEDAGGFVHPYEAYLAGLLHALGALPTLLGWSPDDIAADRAVAALDLADRWSFPVFLRDYFCEVRKPGSNPQVSKIVEQAHCLVESSSRCPMLTPASHASVPTIR